MYWEIKVVMKQGNDFSITLTDEEYDTYQDRVVEECDVLNVNTDDILRIETSGPFKEEGEEDATDEEAESEERPVPGMLIRLTEDAVLHYAEFDEVPPETYRGKTYPITHVAGPGESPAFDETVGYLYMVDAEGFPHAIHDLEFEIVDQGKEEPPTPLSIEELRSTYRNLRALHHKGTDEYRAYDHVYICVRDARTIAEARVYVLGNIKNHRGHVAQSVYAEFMRKTRAWQTPEEAQVRGYWERGE
jgi:hypothetical protein